MKKKFRIDPYFACAGIGALVIVAFIGKQAAWYQSSALTLRTSVDTEAVLAEVESSWLAQSVGPPDSPVSVIEMVDLGCPACSAAHDANWPFLRDQARSGKLRYTAFPFPLPNHPNAIEAALVAHCVTWTDDAKYWDANTLLFSSQRAWGRSYPVLDTIVAEVVEGVGVAEGQLVNCVKEIGVSYRAAVMSSRVRLILNGVTRTPFVLVNGEVVGASDLQTHLGTLPAMGTGTVEFEARETIGERDTQVDRSEDSSQRGTHLHGMSLESVIPSTARHTPDVRGSPQGPSTKHHHPPNGED